MFFDVLRDDDADGDDDDDDDDDAEGLSIHSVLRMSFVCYVFSKCFLMFHAMLMMTILFSSLFTAYFGSQRFRCSQSNASGSLVVSSSI